MFCGYTTKITLIYSVIKLDSAIRLEYCKDCDVTYCKLSSSGCDLFNYIAIKLVTYAVYICLNT